jgi:hypothetical protein
MKSISIAFLLTAMTVFLQKTTHLEHPIISIETCLPENADNKSALDLAITDPELAIIWTRTNITGITTQNVTYVLESDTKCSELLAKYNYWINEKYQNSSVNKHFITFHKYNNYYIVIMVYNNSTEYITVGDDAIYILDDDLELIEGFAF